MRCYSKFCIGRTSAFTLAEMMVVLLIASIILACMAPAITTRIKAEQNNSLTSPWRWTQNGTDAYFSTDSSQTAMIGQREKSDTDSAKLIINNSTNLNDMILFKNGNNVLGRLRLRGNGSIVLGSVMTTDTDAETTLGSNSILLGQQAQATNSYSNAIGREAQATGFTSNAIGYNAQATGSTSNAIGREAQATGSTSNAIGYNAKATGSTSNAIGYNAKAETESSIAIGLYAKAAALSTDNGSFAIAIGRDAFSIGHSAIAIGGQVCAKGYKSIAIGGETCGRDWTAVRDESKFKTRDYAIALGGGAYAEGAIAIGEWAQNRGDYSIAIGSTNSEDYLKTPSVHTAVNSDAKYSIAIGHNSQVLSRTQNSIAIGRNSWVNSDVSNSVAIGADAKAYKSNSVAIGAGVAANAENTIVLGTNAYNVSIPGTLTVKSTVYPSDSRLKNVGKENLDGLAKLRKIKVFNYTFKKDETKTPRVGVIAQDLQKIFPNAVKKGADGFLKIRMEDMFYAVINAIKELDSRVTKLEKENKELRARLEKLEAKMK